MWGNAYAQPPQQQQCCVVLVCGAHEILRTVPTLRTCTCVVLCCVVLRGQVKASLLAHNLRTNGSEAYFVDGAVGTPSSHAAVHSTLYAISAGVADSGGAALAQQLTAYLGRHGVAPSSCMMGRWWVEGLYRLGVWAGEAADLALAVLTSTAYPSWLDMVAQARGQGGKGARGQAGGQRTNRVPPWHSSEQELQSDQAE